VHTTLRNRLYTGEFEWNGHLYMGKHQPLVTRELWERVQGVLDGRHAKKNRRVKHDFAFSGLITCGHCGCSIVGEIKKKRYVYYHCTGFKGRCDEPYVREEVIEQQFADLLGRLKFDDEVLEWVREALDASHADERREHEEAIKRLRAEYDRLQNRIHGMYVDKLDGKVDGNFFERMSSEWRGEQDRCQREIERHQTADQSYLEEGVRILELARNAQRLFEKQEPREKRRLLDFLVSNCSWKGGELSTVLRQPFDLLAETTAIAAQAARDGRRNLTKSEIWLAASVLAVSLSISSPVIANSTARRHLAMMPLLVHLLQTRNPPTNLPFHDRVHGIGRLDRVLIFLVLTRPRLGAP
jgi:site-specific DNA recombinase